MSNKKQQKIRVPKRPEKFRDFSDCLHWVKKSVYMIVRGRKTLIVDIGNQKRLLIMNLLFLLIPEIVGVQFLISKPED